MNKIVIGHHCFGDFIEVDDIDFNISENDNNKKEVDIIKDNILNKIVSLKDKLSHEDWKSLFYIITSLEYWETDEEEGYMDRCDQCGDWNEQVVFIKK